LLRAVGVHGLRLDRRQRTRDPGRDTEPFISVPIAFVLNVVPISRLAFHRHAGWLEVLAGVELAPRRLVVVLTTLKVGGLFVGHLAADSYACWKGVRSAF
jgi:hypothetical protein